MNEIQAPAVPYHDLYSGYNEYPAEFDPNDLANEEFLREALQSSYGRRPATVRSSATHYTPNRAMSSVVSYASRPVTAVRSAGYTSAKLKRTFDPLNLASKMNTPLLKPTKEMTMEEKIKSLERRVMDLINESCLAESNGELKIALEKAKEASTKEHTLIRLLEQAGQDDMHNFELTFNVLFAVAHQYVTNGMFIEALNVYQGITKNKVFQHGSHLRINMGNIYVQLGQYQKAIKMYRWALDHVPNTNKDLRVKIMHNIGIVFVKMKQFDEACSNFEYIMQEKPFFRAGFNHCLELVKNSPYVGFIDALEINKAITYLRLDNTSEAVQTLKLIEQRGSKLTSVAAANLSFIHFLDGNIEHSKKYGYVAHDADVYNPVAYVNIGNCYFIEENYEKAQVMYKQALENDSLCMEALYNLGLSKKKMGNLDDSLDDFLKLQTITTNNPEILYQIAHIYELLDDTDEAAAWYIQLVGLLPYDASILQKIAEIFDKDGDKQQALHYYMEAYRFNPSNLTVLDWLGAYCVETRMISKAITYFEKAAQVQPQEPKWRLLVGSCYRRTGNYQMALQVYKDAHASFPDNADCLKLLVRLGDDLNLKETTVFVEKLKNLEKSKDRVGSSHSSAGSRRTTISRSSIASSEENIDSLRVSASKSSSAGTNSKRELMGPMSVVNDVYLRNRKDQTDIEYNDPIGLISRRPQTSAGNRQNQSVTEEDFDSDELDDHLLP